MPGSMFSWESEDMLVDEYEALIKENREPSVAMHFAGLVIAVALQRFDEDWRHRGWAGGLFESISGQRCVRSMQCP